jgi:phosphohistidine phosphatase
MKVYLVQHAVAKEKSEDESRPLSHQGHEDVTRTAGFLSLFTKPQPALIAHSGKLRARQTAEMIAEAWGVENVEEQPDLGPNDDPVLWGARLAEMKEDVLLVGHLPHLQRLAGLLLTGNADAEPVRFRNAGIVCLEKTQKGWQLLWHIIPTLYYPEE